MLMENNDSGRNALDADPTAGQRYTYARKFPELVSPLPVGTEERDEYKPFLMMNPAFTGGAIAFLLFLLCGIPLLVLLSHLVLGVP